MKRMLFVLAVLALGPLAAAQTTSVKVCEKNGTRCVDLAPADGGALAPGLPALPTNVRGLHLLPSLTHKFTNCAAIGSTAQNIRNGTYVMRVFDERTTFCQGFVCDGGNGDDFPANFAMLVAFSSPDGGTFSNCASSGATGDVQLTGVIQH